MTKVHIVKVMVFPVVMYICESWTIKKAECQRIVALEKILESPLESKIKPFNLKGYQPWIFIERTDAEAPILWPPDGKSQLIGKDPDVGKELRQKEKEATQNEIVEWHHRFNGHELGQTLGDGEGQGGLAFCSPYGHEESNKTWWLNNNYLGKKRGGVSKSWHQR